MEGKTCVITGASSGIGKGDCTRGPGLWARIVLVCRNSKKGELAREAVIRGSGNNAVDLVLADLSSLQGVRDFAERVIKMYDRLDVFGKRCRSFWCEPS